MASNVSWRGEEFKKLLKATTVKKLERAAYELQNAIKESISEPSNHGTTPSAAGEPPHKDLGRLRASISHEIDIANMKARVGTNVIYAKFLELGSRRMAARPFIRPAYQLMIPRILAILKGN